MDYKSLANYCGVTERYIRMIFAGERIPSLRVAKKMGEKLGKTIDEIFFDIQSNLKFESDAAE